MADETPDIPDNSDIPDVPAAPKRPAARKPAASGPGAVPRKPAARQPPVAPAATEAPTATEAPAATEAPEATDAPAAAAAPEPAVVPAPPAPAPLAPPAKRKIWPFVLGGGILVFLLIVVGIVIAIVTVLGGFGQEPKATVIEYDKAYETADCDLYQSLLTKDYQDSVYGGKLDCDQWVENAKSYTVDGKYAFTVKIVISKVDGDDAQVVTKETDDSEGGPYDYTVRYYLVKDGGKWLIDDIQDETPQ